MISRLERWVVGAGLLIWAFVGLPVVAGDLVAAPGWLWWFAYLGYGALLALELVPGAARRWGSSRGLVGLQVAAGIAAISLDGGYGFS